jgi:hypothetical protein
MYSPPQHLNFLSRRMLDAVMAESGLELARRRYTSGGLFNPCAAVPVFGRRVAQGMTLWDAFSPLGMLPIFDHMYSYYRRIA